MTKSSICRLEWPSGGAHKRENVVPLRVHGGHDPQVHGKAGGECCGGGRSFQAHRGFGEPAVRTRFSPRLRKRPYVPKDELSLCCRSQT